MGYQMEYHMQTIKFSKAKKQNKFLRYTGVALAAMVAITLLHFGCLFLETILHGQGNITVAADQMVEEIEKGASLKDAVAVFCSEIGG